MFEATWDSVGSHRLPTWYDDAKLGVFLHWGLYSVPGWAPQVADIQHLLATDGPKALLWSNPYAEWYLNSMRLVGSPTYRHQVEVYGPDAAYDDFRAEFDRSSADADLDELAATIADSGARYVVLTTKHHDGFTLWPATRPHPVKGRYHAARDLVGDTARAVRDRGMRMGLYYSGGYDWPFNDALISNPADCALAVPSGPEYLDYATGHVRELIDEYRPDVLWNDICWPGGGNLAELFAYYYNAVPEGVINDRWREASGGHGRVADAVAHGVGSAIQAFWRFIPESAKSLTFPSAHHYDFRTPEYAHFDEISERKWESTRGVGHSFGANRNERPEDIVTGTELVRSFADIVSKNGNLLIGVGPMPDGRLPDEQVVPLRALGRWLAVNGEAIFATRPWARAETTTTEGGEVRFTARDQTVYAILVDPPGERRIGLRGVDVSEVREVRMLGLEEPLHWQVRDEMLWLDLPDRLPVSPAHVLRLGQGARPA